MQTKTAQQNKPATKAAKPKTQTIGRTKAAELILGPAGSKFFNATFLTKGNKERNITARRQVVKGTVAARTKSKQPVVVQKAPDVAKIGMVRVYDMMKKGYRTINLQTLTGTLKIGGNTYSIRS